MYGKHRRKAPRFLVFRTAAVFVLAIAFSVFSFGTVMANTVSANVIDGDKSYTFSMESADLHRILTQAEKLGLESMGPLDVAEQVENTTTVNIRRGVSMTVTEAGVRRNLVAYLGDTVAKTLEDNNIIVKDGDQVTPSRETLVSAGLSVEIRRRCQVTVTADGESRELSLFGGTVQDALEQAGITLTGKDSVNYDWNEVLFDKMNIRVSRAVQITVTADGKTGTYEVSASTVRTALLKCGITLSDDDRVSVDRKAKPTDGMVITVTRVVAEKKVETEEVDYPVQYVTSDDMYEDESEVRTPGQKGEKEVTYKLLYVAGKLEGKEVVSEKVTKEPVPEVVVKGTKEREGYTFNPVDYGGTFVDADGVTRTYVQKLVEECTAYYPLNPGDITSIGVVATKGIIAVHPDKIPYGTVMYVVSPDGSVVYGEGVAADTGGALLDGDVFLDLCYDTEGECSQIGRRDMVIYILSYPD